MNTAPSHAPLILAQRLSVLADPAPPPPDAHAAPHLLLITLNRPDKRNALTPDMLAALLAQIRAAHADPHARALVLAGSGDAFCAGFDLALCKAAPDGSVMRSLLSSLSSVIVALRALPFPVVLAAHAAAIAGGCALLGGADIVVTDRHAKLGYPVLRLGVSPAVSAPFLRLRLTDAHARARLLDPALISGSHAHQLGLADELVDSPSAVLPRAVELARQLAAHPAVAVRAVRSLLLDLEAVETRSLHTRALAASLALVGTAEERERLASLKL